MLLHEAQRPAHGNWLVVRHHMSEPAISARGWQLQLAYVPGPQSTFTDRGIEFQTSKAICQSALGRDGVVSAHVTEVMDGVA